MSESMAGVTFLAFGNGSPDVFSTFAAMKTNSGSLAVGELIGAAGFITTVVAGSMALVRPFRVAQKSFLRDVGFFIVAASFSMVFLADGYLHLWECAVMVAFYLFYVITVVIWHWLLGRWRQSRDRESLARNTFLGPEEEEEEEEEEAQLGGETEDQIGLARRSRTASRVSTIDDFTALEQGPSTFSSTLDDEADDNTRDRWMAEISRNMRVNRPTQGERVNTSNPIRPSLVGALEFRAVLASLHKSRNQIATANLRRYSDDPAFTLGQQLQNMSGGSDIGHDPPFENDHQVVANELGIPSNETERLVRTRAVSANDAAGLRLNPADLQNILRPSIDLLGPTPPGSAHLPVPAVSESFNTKTLVAEPMPPSLLLFPAESPVSQATRKATDLPTMTSRHLVPPSDTRRKDQNHELMFQQESRTLQSPYLSPRLQTNRQWSGTSILLSPLSGGHSPALQFLPYRDDPNASVSSSRAPSIRLPPPSLSSQSNFTHDDENPITHKTICWWPYVYIPAPNVLASTLFPTLYSWKDKTIWEKFLGVIAAPSILLLAITLPVVEAPGYDVADKFASTTRVPDNNRQNLQFPCNTETVSANERLYVDSLSSVPKADRLSSLQGEGMGSGTMAGGTGRAVGEHERTNEMAAELRKKSDLAKSANMSEGANLLGVNPDHVLDQSSPAAQGWNRWLVCTQIFMAPLFVVLIVWANTDESHTFRNLLVSALYSLIGSLLVLALVLMTTHDTRPPRFRILLSFAGFVVSIAWISTIANEVVGVLKAIGVILDIGDAILGLTIFAVGNSLGDLVADVTVARLGYPVMALSACFGGPMLNILLGIGLSGLYMTIRDSNKKHDLHPGRPIRYKPYQVEVGGTLIISGITLLVTLVGLLLVVPLNKWVMDRRIGWGLIALWCLSTVVNVIVEISG